MGVDVTKPEEEIARLEQEAKEIVGKYEGVLARLENELDQLEGKQPRPSVVAETAAPRTVVAASDDLDL